MNYYRKTYANINLKHLIHNIDTIYSKSKKPLMAIVKANAYGHGDQCVAKALENKNEVIMLGVATLKEAIDLKKANITKPILVIGAVATEDVFSAINHQVAITAYSLEFIEAISQMIFKDDLKVHIKIDTGMNRLGLKDVNELNQAMALLQHNEKIIVEGVFTHFGASETEDDTYQQQINRFKKIIENYDFKYIHADNSAGTMYHHDNFTNMDRLGIGMYGIDPKGNVDTSLKQVMSLYTTVMMVKKIHVGEKVGYNFTYEAKNDQYIATLPIGYADGLIRKNQGRNVYINGKEYEIVGRVCMDQIMVKVDETVQSGDVVEIFGEHISLNRMAQELETIPYEIMCLLSLRVERRYVGYCS